MQNFRLSSVSKTFSVISLAITAIATAATECHAKEPIPAPKPEWLKVAYTEPYAPHVVAGNVNGNAVKLDIATLQPFKDGKQQVLYLMQKTPNAFYNTQVWVPVRGSLEGKTIYFPSTANGEDAGVAIYKKVLDTEHGTGASEANTINGRITFGKIQKGVMPGYICVRFGHNACKQSNLNGYFHATMVTQPKLYPMNMMK